MERLTFEGNFCDIAQCCNVPGGSFCEDGACSQKKVWTRLKAYEDTGLTPEQCENAKAIIESAFSDDTSRAERIRELLKADKDGRLVVLPCKVGDALWTFCTHPRGEVYSMTVTDVSTLNGRTMLNTSRCGVVAARDVGETVFLTREEAEKALAEMEGKKDG
jgi:hypothetical protein|nr:MAG TPA: Dynein light chain type 1 [Caudoviricetes sp.]